MVNVDSDLYRAHPDWVLGPAGRLPLTWRHQQVLDLANPDVSTYLLGRLDVLLDESDIAYLKWDHNRDLLEAVSAGRPRVHVQTLALYALLDELRARHPGVEIESCASGGGRVDLEVLARTDRVWASDCNDALERQTIQRWTGLLLPPELVGAHVGPAPAHTTGRAHAIDLRAATALLGHAGIEADVTALNGGDRSALMSWSSLYRDERALLHTGDVVNGDLPDDAVLRGVVATDGRRALYTYAVVASAPAALPGRVTLPGLRPDVLYRVRQEWRAGAPWPLMAVPPPWLAEGTTLPGRVLGEVGLAFPALMPDHVLVLVAEAVDGAPA
jgi:alpha-galactosidase